MTNTTFAEKFIENLTEAVISKASEKRVNHSVIWNELSKQLWKSSIATSRSNLRAGKFKTIRLEWIPIMCDYLDVKPDDLFKVI